MDPMYKSLVLEIQRLMDMGVDPIDSILKYANDNCIEPEVIGDIVKNIPILLSCVEDDASNKNQLKEPTNKLNF